MITELAEIPAHDPNRYQTTDGLDNPDCTNGARAFLALKALERFQEVCNMVEDVDVATSDLICDLLHLVHSRSLDPQFVVENGINGFLCEVKHIS